MERSIAGSRPSPCTFSPLPKAWSGVGRRYSLPELQLKCPLPPPTPQAYGVVAAAWQWVTITDPWGRDHCTISPQYPRPPPAPGASSIGGHRKGANGTQSGPGKMLPLLPPPRLLLPPGGQASGVPPSPAPSLSARDRSSGVGSMSITRQCCPPSGGFPARAGAVSSPGGAGDTYPHTHEFSSNSSSEAGPRPSPLCTAAAAGCTQDNELSSFSRTEAHDPSSPHLTATVTGRFSSRTLF